MPESVEVCAGSPKKDESPAPSGEVRWEVEDPSEFRPDILSDMGKDETEFRVFNETDPRFDIVKKTYTEMHKYQTVDSVRARMAKWCKLDHCKMTIMEALMKLDQIIDESDPDTSMPNSVHCFQTAERIRAVHPDKEWLHLTGLIHDIGKVVALWGEPQYAVVGDTFPVGCEFSKKCVLHESFEDNPDHHDQRYNTKFGMYEPGCGLDKVLMSFGHDEYLYRVLIGNEQCQLPEESLYIIRFHSFYPWHTGGDYDHLCNDKDRSMLKWIREFNKFDLYSKADDLPKPEDLMDYYQKLIDKYIPGVLNW